MINFKMLALILIAIGSFIGLGKSHPYPTLKAALWHTFFMCIWVSVVALIFGSF